MTDIQNRSDLEHLIRSFYKKALVDEVVGYIFTEVAKLDLEAHVPIIVDFWESVLFQKGSYSRNTMQIHLDLHRQSALKQAHFERWLALFEGTVDELFEGKKAHLAKVRALSIATMMQVKIGEKLKS